MSHLVLKRPTQIILIRHAQSVANTGDTIGGPDSPLTEKGEKQALSLARFFVRQDPPARPTALFTSHYPRATRTTDILAPGFRLPPIIDERLCEIKRGEWDGLPRDTIYGDPRHQRAMDFSDMDHCPPGGESMSMVATRMRAFLHDLDDRDPGVKEPLYLIVTHGIAIKALLQRLFNSDPALAWMRTIHNTSLTKISCDAHGWREHYGNATPHQPFTV